MSFFEAVKKTAAFANYKAIGCVLGQALILAGSSLGTSAAQVAPMTPDIAAYEPITAQADYVRRTAMIPMRDGAGLYTVIVMRKGLADAPVLLSRTPYDADGKTWRIASQSIEDIMPTADTAFLKDGYIRVYQDVRGLGRSAGDYVMVRPVRGLLNESDVDHSTDAYDTIDWLINNVPQSNGKVGITGSSYLGFTALMATLDPHPALKAVVAMSPMVDGWMGDDWFHNGAFRQSTFGYTVYQMAKKGGGALPIGTVDHYSAFLKHGSASAFAKAYGLDVFPVLQKMMQHPAYDAYWQLQAVDKRLAQAPLKVPTMLVTGHWDQEDNYGAPAVYRALEPKDKTNHKVFFVMGPWRHSGVLYDGSRLGQLNFHQDTALQFRRDLKKPFLDQYLKNKAPAAQTPPVLTYATGINAWQETAAWPPRAAKDQALYFADDGAMAWEKPAAISQETYTSDPEKPVPFMPRPVDMSDPERWRTWRLADQRFVEGRPDVLDYRSQPLSANLHIAGEPRVDLWASTSGSDSDWVVKLIDEGPSGDQTMIGIEIFRGRYQASFETPAPLEPNAPYRYQFALPNVDHVFQEGHRLVVHIQSTLFPLYDRNPQQFVENIFFAEAGDYQRAKQSIFHGGGNASAIYLPVLRPQN